MALLGLAFVVFVVVVLVLRAPGLGGSGPVRRPVIDLVVAGVAGAALGARPPAPWAPAHERIGAGGRGAARPWGSRISCTSSYRDSTGCPSPEADGSGPRSTFAPRRTSGIVGVVLAAVGVRAAIRQRHTRPEVLGLAAVAVVTASVVFVPPVVSLMDALPSVGPVTWNRSLLPLAFALAMLAGVGTDSIVSSWGERALRRWSSARSQWPGPSCWRCGPSAAAIFPPPRRPSGSGASLWPALATVAGVVVVLVASSMRSHALSPRHGRAPDRQPARGAGSVGRRTASRHRDRAPRVRRRAPSVVEPVAAFSHSGRGHLGALRWVGSLVGFGTNACFTPEQLGIVPDVNVAFGVRELAVYDPLFPKSYYSSWLDATGVTGAPEAHATVPFSLFCPAVTSTAVARRYGIGFVLEPAGTPGPVGMVRDRTVGDEVLYRVPGAADATLVPSSVSGRLPALDAPGVPVTVDHPGPATWRIVTRARREDVLRLRLTDVPGWHATLDGRPLVLVRYAGVMLQARVPPGHHTVELRYRPATFTLGLVLAAAALVGLVGAAIIGRLRGSTRRKRLTAPS